MLYVLEPSLTEIGKIKYSRSNSVTVARAIMLALELEDTEVEVEVEVAIAQEVSCSMRTSEMHIINFIIRTRF